MNWLLFCALFLTQTVLPHALAIDHFHVEKSAIHRPAIEVPASPKLHKSLFAIGTALSYQPKSYGGLSAKGLAYYQNKDRQTYYLGLVQNLFLLNNGTQNEHAKAFNAIVYGNHPAQYLDVNAALLKVLQARCYNEGKLISLDRDPYLTACIYQALKDALPHKVYLDVLKAFNDKTSIELLEAEQSYTFLGYYWTAFWEALNRLLNDYTQRSSCSWQQIINHPFNLTFKELQYTIDCRDYFEAQEIAKQDPLFEKYFSSCCQTFIHKQNHLQKIAAIKTEKFAQAEDSCPFSFNTATHELDRTQALNEALTQPTIEKQDYNLSKHSEKLLTSLSINPNNFKLCYGNQLQHTLHKEHLQIIESSAGIYFVPNQQQDIKDIIEHTVQFVNVARHYNHAGYVHQAITVSDCCWAFLDCAQNIAKGIGKGLYQGTKNVVDYAVDHPIETLARPVFGNFILAYRLGQLTAQLIDVGRIGISARMGNQDALQEWQQLCSNVTAIKNALTEKCKTLSLQEGVQHATAFVTEAFLDYKCASALNKFYQTGERKTLELIGKLKNNLPPPPLHAVALTPEGFEIGIAAQATAVATGNTKSVLKKLEDFGGGSNLCASTAQSLQSNNKQKKNFNTPQKVNNLHEFFEELPFGQSLKKNIEKVKGREQIYRVTQNIDHTYLGKDDYFYLDRLHGDHIEVFNSRGKVRFVLNLNGSLNTNKTDIAIKQNRSIKV